MHASDYNDGVNTTLGKRVDENSYVLLYVVPVCLGYVITWESHKVIDIRLNRIGVVVGDVR